jgi:hypothetical protein
METACGLVNSLLAGAADEECPNDECTRYNPNLNGGRGGYDHFHAYADGRSFYLPGGVNWTGDAFTLPGGLRLSFVDGIPNRETFDTQSSVTENDPDTLQGENNGKDCGIEVKFKPGTSYPDAMLVDGTPLRNGPTTVPSPVNGLPMFGLGFSVSGWVNTGGIGRIGSDTQGKVNPANPNGKWTIDQETAAWIRIARQTPE